MKQNNTMKYCRHEWKRIARRLFQCEKCNIHVILIKDLLNKDKVIKDK